MGHHVGNISDRMVDPYADVSTTFLQFNITLSVITTSIAIPGNMALIIIFIAFRKLRDLNNVAITLLSATDLLRSCVVMTLKIHNQLYRSQNMDKNSFVCGLTAVTSSFSFVFCPLMLAFIAFVRYYKIVPHGSKSVKLSDSSFYKICTIMFVVTTLFSLLPYMGVGSYAYSHIHGVCFVDWSHDNATFRILFYLLAFFVAFPVLACSYTMLYMALRHNKRRLMKHYVNKGEGDPSHGENKGLVTRAQPENKALLTPLPQVIGNKEENETKNEIIAPEQLRAVEETKFIGSKEENEIKGEIITPEQSSKPLVVKQQQQQQQHRNHTNKHDNRVTHLLVAIFIAYLACWLPGTVLNIWALFKVEILDQVVSTNFWFYTIVTLEEMKSALDPIIYGLGNERYRKAAVKLVGDVKKKILCGTL